MVFLRFRLAAGSVPSAVAPMLVETDCARQCAGGGVGNADSSLGNSEPHDRIRALSGQHPPAAAAPAVPTETPTQLAWLAALLRPIRGFRLRYLPLILVYFAYGALGLIDVTRDMWIKEQLRLGPSDLAAIGVWLGLPWAVKMVFGELVDSVPIFGSQRRSYILIGAACTAAGMLTLAGAAAG